MSLRLESEVLFHLTICSVTVRDLLMISGNLDPETEFRFLQIKGMSIFKSKVESPLWNSGMLIVDRLVPVPRSRGSSD